MHFANANKEKGTPLLEIFDLGRYSSLTEVLFIEKSLKLLKPGGRMGIVLPEGVLNNNALQKVRDYVEGTAKIINITSIPQDVFIASGATVKPSLVFLKKFTVEEQEEYKHLKGEIENKVNMLHKETIHEIQTQYSDLRELYKSMNDKISLAKIRKEEKQKINQIILQVEKDIKLELKKEFNYSIPIVEVKKAGISSTGATIDNELIPVANEFKQYRKNMNLWDNSKSFSLK